MRYCDTADTADTATLRFVMLRAFSGVGGNFVVVNDPLPRSLIQVTIQVSIFDVTLLGLQALEYL